MKPNTAAFVICGGLAIAAVAFIGVKVGISWRQQAIEQGAQLAKIQAEKSSEEQKSKAAIEEVFKKRVDARKACTRIEYFPAPLTNLIEPSYVVALRKIDTSATPKAFQLAWLDYVQSWERKQDLLKQTASKIELALGAAKGSPGATQDALSRMDKSDTTEAFRKVVRVALELGVKAPLDAP